MAIHQNFVAPLANTQSSDNLSTLHWRTEHDSKYTPIVFTQDLRYQIIILILTLYSVIQWWIWLDDNTDIDYDNEVDYYNDDNGDDYEDDIVVGLLNWVLL